MFRGGASLPELAPKCGMQHIIDVMNGNAHRIGGIVLCGGKSSRMGRPKAWLPFGDEVLLQRVVRIVKQVVSPVVVVAARGQELPPLDDSIGIARDEYEALGPLAGLATGLASLADRADAAFACPCDTALLRPEFIREIIGRLGSDDLVIPRDGKYHHPLAAVYRVSVEPQIRSLLAADRLRPVYLLELVNGCEVDVENLRTVDPHLQSLRNLNTPDDYEAALREAGISR
jgi:molybdenum cofactor guanylyltransferase